MNEGAFYRRFIDPLLRKPHNIATKGIIPGSTALDIACGNGTLPLKHSRRASHVTGIDISEASLEYGRRRAEKAGVENVDFIQLDATELSLFSDQNFDYATVSMAIHQFNAADALSVLNEMKRVAQTIIIIDYNYPLRGLGGMAAKLIERMAEEEHNRNFMSYMEKGGLSGALKTAGLKEKRRLLDSNVFIVAEVN
jgi:demethylmenaquinone methyltransferase/2-methoxy-6-polyprenyl-1,4-benzoquinol methylase